MPKMKTKPDQIRSKEGYIVVYLGELLQEKARIGLYGLSRFPESRETRIQNEIVATPVHNDHLSQIKSVSDPIHSPG